MIYSFDVFDTLITRLSYNPEDIHLYVQEYLLQHNNELGIQYEVLKRYHYMRINAEKNARYYHGKGDVTFDEIYMIFAYMTGLDLSEIEIFKFVEQKIELEFCIGIKENIEFLKKKLYEGNEVVLISDMYLDECFIRKLLVKQDRVFKELPIFVSSDYNRTKSSGELYKYLQNTYNWDFSNWIHYGDNEKSDFYIPLTLGMQANLVEKKENFSWFSWNKDIINNKMLINSVEAQLILGINKFFRSGEEKTLSYKIGFSVVGAILFSYIKWIIDVSCKKKIYNLFFIARDGFILKLVADLYIQSKNLSIKTQYIYGSRRAWRTEDSAEQELVRKYFYQEIGEKKNYALVDLQGTGKSIENLTNIVGQNLKTFYYYYFGDNRVNKCENYIYTFKDDINNIETLCRANHGATIGYKIDSLGKCVPILQEEKMTKLQKEKFEQYVNGICDFTKFICKIQRSSGILFNFEQIGNVFLRQINDATDKNISDFIGEIPHSDGNMPNRVYAPIISKEEMEIYITNPELYNGDNFAYSVKRSGDDVKKIYEKYLDGKTLFNWNIKIKKKIKIIQFGAGKIGKAIHPYFEQLDCIDVVGWADSLYIYYEKIGMDVKNIHEIKMLNFDYLVMTIGRSLRDEVRDFLINEGISKEKIVTLDEFKNIVEAGI